MTAFRLTSFEQLFKIRLLEETKAQYQKESEEWIKAREKPDSPIY